MDKIKTWFDKHPNLRVGFKYCIIGVVGGILYIVGVYAAKLGPEWFGIANLIIAALNEKFKLLNPLEPWPVVGAKAPETPAAIPSNSELQDMGARQARGLPARPARKR